MVRGNFLQLDADASGKIDPVELVSAARLAFLGLQKPSTP